VVENVTEHFENLDSPLAASALRDFTDVLTNWYIRRSRDRFWEGDPDALDTLYTVLETLCRIAAPLAPLITEEVWRGITGHESVHLADWPEASDYPSDSGLVDAMDVVRDVASAGLSLRKAHGLRVRLPLGRLTVVSALAERITPFVDIISSELNVKNVEVVAFDEGQATRFGIGRKLLPNARALGPRIGGGVQQVIADAKADKWVDKDGVVVVGDVELLPGEYEVELTSPGDDQAVAFLDGGGFVILDTTVSHELALEGIARDTIRWVQQERKNSGLDVSDRISLHLGGDATAQAAWSTHRDLIAKETLATELEIGDPQPGNPTLAVGDDSQITVTVSSRGH
jgi:isoleucyl-tRNA synthetase